MRPRTVPRLDFITQNKEFAGARPGAAGSAHSWAWGTVPHRQASALSLRRQAHIRSRDSLRSSGSDASPVYRPCADPAVTHRPRTPHRRTHAGTSVHRVRFRILYHYQYSIYLNLSLKLYTT